MIGVNQVIRDLDLAPTCDCRLGERRARQMINGVCQRFHSETAAPPVLVLKPANSVSPCMSLVLFEPQGLSTNVCGE